MDWMLKLDTQLFLAINGIHTETWDAIMWWISGKTTWWPFYLLLVGYMGWKRGWQLVPAVLFIVVVIFLADQTSVHLFKNVNQRLRPSHEPSLEGMVHLVNNKKGGLYGFISSHAANAAGVVAMTALWIRKRWFTLVMIVWSLLIGYSRVYLGVHYPGDVLAGLLWGAGCGWLVYLVFCRIMKFIPGSWWIAGTKRGD